MDPRHLSERDAEAGLASPGINPYPYPDDGDVDDRHVSRGAPARTFGWKVNVLLFLATVVCTLLHGASYRGTLVEDQGFFAALRSLPTGWTFSVPLLAILLTHEFGHYFAARIHRVPASLPFFIPIPILGFGTLGAVIAMPERIRSRNALLDIGAAGPLAGLLVAIPVLVIGLNGSPVEPMPEHGIIEGQSLFYLAVKRLVLGPIPDGYDVSLNATAMAGWVGLLVTMLNLLPVSQLDGGHIAYALFGKKQHRYARVVHWALLLPVLVNLVRFVVPAVLDKGEIGLAIGNSVQLLPWFGLVHVLKRLAGPDHPPTDPGELSPVRTAVAVFSLALFVLLFMPTLMTAH
jgi:membrane-associated protease RseP (regulator of RpoE activity)